MVDAHLKTTNNLDSSVPKFCLALERNRRTPDGRIRSEHDFREYFFPYDENSATDRILCHLPREVRGPVIASWGIRGQKAALRDDDMRVRMVVHDALVAGDVDDQMFEDGLHPETVIGWLDLADWWSFWRGGKHTKHSIQQALENGYDLGLFDARWFFEVIESPGGRLKGTDVVTEGLSKAELSEWIKKIHASGDGSPAGLIGAVGWTTIVARTANDILLAVIDKIAAKNDLAKGGSNEQRRSVRPPPLPGGEATGWSFPPPTRETDGAQATAGAELEGFGGAAAIGTVVSAVGGEDANGDWLDNPVSVTATDGSDDLDVLVDSVVPSATDGGVTPSAPAVREEMSAAARDEEHMMRAPSEESGTGRFKLPGIPVLSKRKSMAAPSPEKGTTKR